MTDAQFAAQRLAVATYHLRRPAPPKINWCLVSWLFVNFAIWIAISCTAWRVL